MFEEYTEEFFMEKAREMGEKLGVDTRQGSVYMDAVTGHCYRTAKFYSDLSLAFEMLNIDTCCGDILEEKAKERQIYRKEATPSYYEVNFSGVKATDMIGDRFMAGEYYFVLEECNAGYYLRSEIFGAKTNFILHGTEVIPVRNRMELTASTIGNLYMAGTDEESDDSLRERYKNALKAPAENGNKQQYKTWCESYEGVGRATIIPLAYGENTVKALIISSDGTAPTQVLVEQIQEDIDPNSEGLGEGLSFIGCRFFCEGAIETIIDISFDAELKSGYTIDTALELVKAEITEYLKNITLSTHDGDRILVQYVKVVGILADIPSIKDFSNLTLNGVSVNISIAADNVPVLGEVSMNVSI